MLSFIKIIFIALAAIFIVSYLSDTDFSIVGDGGSTTYYDNSDGIADRSAYIPSYDNNGDGIISDSEYRRGELDRIEEELEDIEYEVALALEETNKSVFRDLVYLSTGNVSATRAKQEYLTLYTTAPRVKLTGWILKSLLTGKGATIGEYRGNEILVRDDDYVQIYTGEGTTREDDGTWTIYLDKRNDLWRSEHDAIALIDTVGKIVDVLRY